MRTRLLFLALLLTAPTVARGQTSAGTLRPSLARIDASITQALPEIAACYAAAHERAPRVWHADFQLEVTMHPQGFVTVTGTLGPGLRDVVVRGLHYRRGIRADEALHACVIAAVRTRALPLATRFEGSPLVLRRSVSSPFRR